MKHRFAVAPLVALAALSLPAVAQGDPSRTMPMAPALPPAIPAAQDVAYPGTVSLRIDASDTGRGVYRVTQVFPVAPGARSLTLLQPSWLPGNHSPTGPAALLADIHFLADGKEIAWTRDAVAVNAFHLALPQGTKEVTARFVHTSPLQGKKGGSP